MRWCVFGCFCVRASKFTESRTNRHTRPTNHRPIPRLNIIDPSTDILKYQCIVLIHQCVLFHATRSAYLTPDPPNISKALEMRQLIKHNSCAVNRHVLEVILFRRFSTCEFSCKYHLISLYAQTHSPPKCDVHLSAAQSIHLRK